MQHVKIFKNCQKEIIIINIYISWTFEDSDEHKERVKYIGNIFVELQINFYQSIYI